MLVLKNVSKRYNYKKILHNISIQFPDTGLIGIIGPSGCGKTTLLNIIGGIDADFNGDLMLNNDSVKRKLDRYRRKHVSFIFQNNHLINWLSPRQNIIISRYFKSIFKGSTYKDDIEAITDKVPYLSHGQRGLISYLRAFFYDKDIIVADEPTGAMDIDNAIKLMEQLKELSRDRLIVLVSHDLSLVESYCDEIYCMKDGYIEEHIIKNESEGKKRQVEKANKILFPMIRLSLCSLFSHKKRSVQVFIGVLLSMICVLCTLTLSFNLKNSIYDYIYSLVPPSSISVFSHDEITNQLQSEISSDDDIDRFHLFLDDCELLGLSFDKKRYQYSSTLFIQDDSSPYQNMPLKLGKYPTNDNEILISLSTAKHLLDESDMNKLIHHKIYAWYKIYDSCVPIEYTIVGITSLNTKNDVIYQMDNAYISLLENKGLNVKSTYGLIYLNESVNRDDYIKELEYNYKDMDFKVSGKSTIDKADDLFDKVECVLIVFSSLIVVSSVVLMGEVSFLNVVLKRKDLAIMKCFGANTFDLIRLVLLESIEIMGVVCIFVVSFYYVFIHFLNTILNDMLLMEGIFIKGNIGHIIIVVFGGLLLMFISQFTSLIYIAKLNTYEALKD